MQLACYWWKGKPNFGDQLTPFLIERVTGHEVCWTCKNSPRLLSAGSIIDQAQFGDIIWGSGIQYDDSPIPKGLDIRMLRGPLTRDHVARSYDVRNVMIGDSVMLLPEFYEPKRKTVPGITVLPHYRDKQHYDGADRQLDIGAMAPLDLIDEIVASEIIVTSALHPLIVAEAYGVKAIAVRNDLDPIWHHSQKLKFQDYYESTQREDWSIPYVDMQSCLQHVVVIPRPDFPDRRKMIKAFPWDRLRDLITDNDEETCHE